MTVAINGATGTTTPGTTFTGSTSGSILVQAPATAGTNTLTLPAVTDTLVGLAATQTLTGKTLTSPTITGAVVSSMGSSVLTSGTAVASTSGTSIDFTGIPSWVKRITVMLSNVSTAAINANTYIRIGTGTVESTGYNTNYIQTNGSNTFAILNTAVGFHVGFISSAANTMVAVGVINLIGNNTWTYSANCFENAATRAFIATGSITLGASLNVLSVVLTSSSFDAGTINIMYE